LSGGHTTAPLATHEKLGRSALSPIVSGALTLGVAGVAMLVAGRRG